MNEKLKQKTAFVVVNHWTIRISCYCSIMYLDLIEETFIPEGRESRSRDVWEE